MKETKEREEILDNLEELCQLFYDLYFSIMAYSESEQLNVINHKTERRVWEVFYKIDELLNSTRREPIKRRLSRVFKKIKHYFCL